MKRTNKPDNAGKQQYRFYRSNLPAIVWDPDKDRPLADFSKGHFTTDDLNVAKTLLDKGYVQIPLDQNKPPKVLVRIPGKSLINTNENVGALDDIKQGLPNLDDEVRVPVTQEMVE